MFGRRRVRKRSRHHQEIARRIAQQFSGHIARKGFVVRFAVRGSCDEEIIREILHRGDDCASSGFPRDPTNFSPLFKALEEPLVLFGIEYSSVHDIQACPTMASEELRLGKHLAERRRKC